MDPVFNDTATYNIPHNQTFSPYSDSARAVNDANSDEQDAVQNFLRGAEEENARLETAQFQDTNGAPVQNDPAIESTMFQSLANAAAYAGNATLPQDTTNHIQNAFQTGLESSSRQAENLVPETSNVLQTVIESATEADSYVKPISPFGQGGVDYQSLLDTISQSASTAPAADSVSAPTTASAIEQGTHALPFVPGLPPKPPVQEIAPEDTFSNYAHPINDSHGIQNHYQQPDLPALPHFDAQQAHAPIYLAQAPGQMPLQASPTISNSGSNSIRPPQPPKSTDPIERKMSPQTQIKYDQFLDDERRYVTEGIWDKFPMGSRLFVGNLPSEKVTKRDLFFTFHKHGRLAQISIKQAYGFVQYLEASSCSAALAAEQGVEIRGRKVHLEISKPQKNTRNPNQGNKRRRSRSPERRQNDRYSRNSFDSYRDDRGRRDEYRGGRSPSPRRYRSGDDYRPSAQSPRFGTDTRPRSPYANAFPPPLPTPYDEEASLPLPRRDPRDVPDIQLLILEPSVAQSFINWIEQGFRSKGLRASTIWLSSRLPLNGVVKRQILEGVQAIVKLTQAAQYNSKIPLQVFDRSSGAANVNFNEYADLDIPVAADIVAHARQKERPMVQQQSFTPQPYNQGHPQFGHPQPPQFPAQLPPNFPTQHQNQFQQYNQPGPYQNQVQTPVTPNSANAPNLQQLLANLRQPGDSQKIVSPNDRPTPDLAGLLSNAVRQQSQGGQFAPPPHQHQQQGYGSTPAYGAGPQQPQQNVQNIMETLARYNR